MEVEWFKHRQALVHIELFKYPLRISRLVNKHSFREVFKLQAQTKLGFTQVFHLKLRLEVSHCFLNVPGHPDDIQIIDIDGDDAKSICRRKLLNRLNHILPVQPIQRPLQADAEHVAVLIRSRDLESFRDSHVDLRI
jgi:hypothetical protein